MRILPIICFITLFVCTSCADSEKKKKLEARELSLEVKEKEFAVKEEDYRSLLALRDSIKNLDDSVAISSLPENILGKWNGKMICIESSCAEHVIGDQKNDVWEFSEKGTTVLAKVTDRSGNLKIYSGNYSGFELKLNSEGDSTSSRKTEINLILNNVQKNILRGTRKITGDTNCIAKFSLELEKINK